MRIIILIGGCILALVLPFIFYIGISHLLAPFYEKVDSKIIKSMEECSNIIKRQLENEKTSKFLSLTESEIDNILEDAANKLNNSE